MGLSSRGGLRRPGDLGPPKRWQGHRLSGATGAFGISGLSRYRRVRARGRKTRPPSLRPEHHETPSWQGARSTPHSQDTDAGTMPSAQTRGWRGERRPYNPRGDITRVMSAGSAHFLGLARGPDRTLEIISRDPATNAGRKTSATRIKKDKKRGCAGSGSQAQSRPNGPSDPVSRAPIAPLCAEVPGRLLPPHEARTGGRRRLHALGNELWNEGLAGQERSVLVKGGHYLGMSTLEPLTLSV